MRDYDRTIRFYIVTVRYNAASETRLGEWGGIKLLDYQQCNKTHHMVSEFFNDAYVPDVVPELDLAYFNRGRHGVRIG